MNIIYFAHSNIDQNRDTWHLLKNHLEDTGALAASLASPFEAEKLAFAVGLLHDAGKYSPKFQSRLQGEQIKVDHSTAGCLIAVEKYPTPIAKIMAYAIAGHHSGLPDWGSKADESSLASRLDKEKQNHKLMESNAFFQEISLPSPSEVYLPSLRPTTGKGFCIHFFIRFLYSCLVDADYLDTEKALDEVKSSYRVNSYSLGDYLAILEKHLDSLCKSADNNLVNSKRTEVLMNCRKTASQTPGLFSLTVPTGGGKTLSSLNFALKHAYYYNKERIIYVIPYTSIIEQNAAVFKNILGADNVLEHHSNFSYPGESQVEIESEYTGELTQKLKLAAENWDMPLIVTTNVQFFESLYSSRSSSCRKLHNIANSVVVIDEAQMIPTDYLNPCLNTLIELSENYKSTVVFCTATQPNIQQILPEGVNPTEIIDDPVSLYKSLKRVNLNYLGKVENADLSSMMIQHHQVLTIVNSKKHARTLHELIHQKEGAFHLSTRMCAAHRTEMLKTIKDRLKENYSCRVVSTQLIEAGVDVDFPVVYRSMTGLDSIAQAAGRCNREGIAEAGQVYVFWPEKHGMPGGWLSRTAEIGGKFLEACDEPLGVKEVKEYFSRLYEYEKLDKKEIISEIKEQESDLNFPFRTVAENFKLIDDFTHTVIIPWDEHSNRIMQEIESSQMPGSYSRSLQKYTVEVFENEFRDLLDMGALQVIAKRYYVLKEEFFNKYYTYETGLLPFTENMFLKDNFII